ncbi:MAG TPA: tetratricopeptide repeat protein, partial [Pyrinomonadaceae bacterium]
DRYQTAKDFLIDLRHLKRKIEVEAEIDRTVPPEFRGVTPTVGVSKPPSTVGDGAASTLHSGSSAEYIVSGIKRHKLVSLAAVVVIVLAIVGISWYVRARNTEVAIDSVAVMPFENQNRQDDMDYMSDGLTDSIINSLTQLPNLRVIARSSVFRYKGKQTDPLVAAKELGVRAILTGRILQRGDSVTISTELIDARDNKQIWGEQYDRKVSDLMSVQREIAQEITSNLRLKLSSVEQGQMAKSYTDNAEAYTLYMKGRFYWNKRTDEGLRKSVEYFNQALERDPSYALAYAGLADSLFTMGWYRTLPWNDAWQRSRAAANKALELDPKLAEAHTTMGMIKANYEWDWAGAEKEFKLALELNPKYPTGHHRYSLFLPILGRLDEAVAEAKKAQELDPLSLIINENVGDVLIVARRYDEAEKQLLKTIELDPSFDVAHATLSRVYEAKGMWEKALEQNFYNDPSTLSRLKKIYAESGEEGLLRADRDFLLDQAKKGDERSFWIATSYAQLGDNDKAFEWLTKAVDERAIIFTYFVSDYRWDKVRSDPRYTAVLRRVGLAK